MRCEGTEMIKSMTGFSTVTREDERAIVSVTIRSVNHRYLDVQLRTPPLLADAEPKIRALVSRRVSRGRVEIGVSLQSRSVPEFDVEFNDAFGRALAVAVDQARARGLVAGSLTPGDLLRLPQAVAIRERPRDAGSEGEPELATHACAVVAEALTDLDAMRMREGDLLRIDLDQRRAAVADLVERISAAVDEGRRGVEQRLAARVRELRQDVQVDEAAVAQEVVRTAARSDISEEVARFRAHVLHWSALADGPEPCGRKLDFLLQEMNREVNTMGSKADGVDAAHLIVAAKAELEKMREQAQNVE
jgi:uncharacterized protein (TIGR00255 family)